MLLLLLACSGSEPTLELAPITPTEASEEIVQQLCAAAVSGAVACKKAGSQAIVPERAELDIAVVIDSFTALPGRTIGMGASAQKLPGEVTVAATVQLSVEGKELMSTELSASGSDVDPELAREAALDALAQRFVVGHGVAVLDAVVGSPEARTVRALSLEAPAAVHGEHGVWTSYPMLGAQGVDPNSVRNHSTIAQALMANLGSFLEQLEPGGLHTLEVQARLGGGGAPGRCPILPKMMVPGSTVSAVPFEGVVLLDGQPTGDICELATTVNWPLPPQGATLEWTQVMVVGAAPEQPTEED